MQQFHELTPSEQICAFLEGELDDTQEEALFKLMEQQPELRSEMKQFYVVRDLLHNDAESLRPGAAHKAGVMRAVGIQRAGERPSRLLWGALAGLGGMLGKSAGYIAVAGLTAAASYFLLRAPGNDTPAAAPVPHIVSQSTDVLQGEDPQQAAANGNRLPRPGADAGATRAAQAQRSGLQPALNDSKPAETHTTGRKHPQRWMPHVVAAPDADARPPAHAVSPVQLRRDEGLQSKTAMAAGTPATMATPLALLQAVSPANEDEHLRLSLRGFSARHYPNNGQEPRSAPLFNNMAAGIFRGFSEQVQVGIEIGQEAFAQSFSATRGALIDRIYQKPLLLWSGATLQYHFSQFDIGGFQPYAGITAAYTKVGPLGRAQAGVCFTPAGPVRMSLGIEGSSLWYTYQNNWHSSRKLGISYGITYSL